ncbi:hypothetical protein A3J17_02435 [Candidatus Curtissbacteria bacterium RIFCSPLOWO2_02_FULL_40_11]|uniref:Uncharacterized protein n=2 Tax=Candidatus Curtissiibacteriota TaxID=1752717 RepID=A0A1F5GCD9_9BACT|nr:MAG: hypothetical protein A3D04_00375 [Candidatus Curtissbacteria bacterium RIFCSPHIGHO2_02_FULL_40_16b]OGD91048.1 MAG: hypothetical protein A3E11_00235 [Candidatus Curtissbacteria bacterium RIFCSPHIGHO2_12_FULL_38_37]OGD99382.1 MAG: hypothetical protein A3J17_02435 [Candidatus Curtissbacteria bacterium RIFCSPLOWO2_02_FULL_40_11]OGE14241.1 MAG: hypothetical protein A3G14_04340 [Candidatus Curtissbacteria bacterium RIFCSPLOWO2_12_FULL_38_9]
MNQTVESRPLHTENLWTNTPKEDGSHPIIILAQVLTERGLGVHIYETALDHQGIIVPDDVAVKATPDGQEALRKVSDTPEYQALFRSKSFTQGEPDVDSCQWDNPTKKLVLAIYWITQSKGFVRISNSIDVSKNQARAVTRIDELNKETEKSTNKTKKLIRQAVEELGGFPEGFFPLEPEDSNEEGFIRSLVVEIVNRELGPSS